MIENLAKVSISRRNLLKAAGVAGASKMLGIPLLGSAEVSQNAANGSFPVEQIPQSQVEQLPEQITNQMILDKIDQVLTQKQVRREVIRGDFHHGLWATSDFKLGNTRLVLSHEEINIHNKPFLEYGVIEFTLPGQPSHQFTSRLYADEQDVRFDTHDFMLKQWGWTLHDDEYNRYMEDLENAGFRSIDRNVWYKSLDEAVARGSRSTFFEDEVLPSLRLDELSAFNTQWLERNGIDLDKRLKEQKVFNKEMEERMDRLSAEKKARKEQAWQEYLEGDYVFFDELGKPETTLNDGGISEMTNSQQVLDGVSEGSVPMGIVTVALEGAGLVSDIMEQKIDMLPGGEVEEVFSVDGFPNQMEELNMGIEESLQPLPEQVATMTEKDESEQFSTRDMI